MATAKNDVKVYLLIGAVLLYLAYANNMIPGMQSTLNVNDNALEGRVECVTQDSMVCSVTVMYDTFYHPELKDYTHMVYRYRYADNADRIYSPVSSEIMALIDIRPSVTGFIMKLDAEADADPDIYLGSDNEYVVDFEYKACMSSACSFSTSSMPPACVPATEVCDGKDNDCDHIIDEDAVCGSNIATVCATDAKLCSDGTYVSRVLPTCEFASCPAEYVITPPGEELVDGEVWPIIITISIMILAVVAFIILIRKLRRQY